MLKITKMSLSKRKFNIPLSLNFKYFEFINLNFVYKMIGKKEEQTENEKIEISKSYINLMS